MKTASIRQAAGSAALARQEGIPPWPTPQDRDFASLIDYHLYGEVLQIASAEAFVTAETLSSPEEGLRNRTKKLFLIRKPTPTNVSGLLSILARFSWLRPHERDRHRFAITVEGRTAASLYQGDELGFRRLLARRLNDRYVVPGWFVHRLYSLNPPGQGEVVLPAPRRSFTGERRQWADSCWNVQLDSEVIEAAREVNRLLPGSFPANEDRWLELVRAAWQRLGRRAKTGPKSDRQTTFGVRGRLSHAMREAAVTFLFGARPPGGRGPDFVPAEDPVHARSFDVWCPRLSELEIIFYTDYHPLVPGKIIVPCGAFRQPPAPREFEQVDGIRDPLGDVLFLFQPSWSAIRENFLGVLLEAYRTESKRVGAFYVSLLAVRDEVCRRLRLSAELFDRMIAIAYEEAIRDTSADRRLISISLESDIRPDQRTAVGLNQRPVYIKKVPQSLIAIQNN
jgi:hypothetical protein